MSSRLCAALLLALSFGALTSAGDARAARRTAVLPLLPVSHGVAFMGYLRDGRVATVYADGRVTGVEAEDPYFGGVGPRRTGCRVDGNPHYRPHRGPSAATKRACEIAA